MAPHALHLLLALIAALLLAVVSVRARALTPGGGAAQAVLGFLLLGLGGWTWTLPILVFFVLSSLLSRRGHGPRTARQVLANGGPAGAAVLLWFLTADPAWAGAYAGSIAAATADTWGTEVGRRSAAPPRLVTTWQIVPAGTSGGVTPLGLLAGAGGAGVIGFSSLVLGSAGSAEAIGAMLLCGMAGATVDSLAGALFQVRYRCIACTAVTEERMHCAAAGIPISGMHWLDNDGVNLLCTLAGAALGFVFGPF
jgi:uncharacterized protein (TIGR00297 family)